MANDGGETAARIYEAGKARMSTFEHPTPEDFSKLYHRALQAEAQLAEQREWHEKAASLWKEEEADWLAANERLRSEIREARADRESAQRLATTLRKTLDRQREETVKGSERADRAESQFQEARERLRLANIDVFNTEAEVASLTASNVELQSKLDLQSEEIARHHADFEKWEAMAAKGAGLLAIRERIREEQAIYSPDTETRHVLDRILGESTEPPPEGVAKWAPIENERELERLRAIEDRANAVLGLIDPRTVNEYGRGQYAAACAILAVDGPPEPRYDNDAILMQDNDAILGAAPAPKEETPQ